MFNRSGILTTASLSWRWIFPHYTAETPLWIQYQSILCKLYFFAPFPGEIKLLLRLIWFLIIDSCYFVINALNLVLRIEKSLIKVFQYILTLYWEKELHVRGPEMEKAISFWSILNCEPVFVLYRVFAGRRWQFCRSKWRFLIYICLLSQNWPWT